MTSDSPQLQRGLFGYRPASVRQILAGRESMFRFAQERAQAAEAKVGELQAELDAARVELIAQAQAAEATQTKTRAELQEVTEALREETHRAVAVDAKLSELQTELDAAGVELIAQAQAAEATQTKTRAELQEATEALRLQTDQAAEVDARLSELQTELAVARRAAQQHVDASRELVSVRAELEAAQTELAARSEQARSSKDRIVDLLAELEAARAELRERVGEPMKAPMAQAEDLSVMLDAAERGVTGIMERARQAYEDQLAQAESVREAIQADIERFSDWQEHVEPLIRSVQQGIETARGRIIRIPDQIRGAVDSMTDAMMAVSDSLDRLATLPAPSSEISLPLAEESVDRQAETVIRLHRVDPATPDSGIPPSDASRTEPAEADRTETRIEPEGSVESRSQPHNITYGESLGHQRP
jgi:chromosome segregation ATPase